MNEPFKALLETKDLWLPALTWLLGQLSATGSGIKIEEGIKKRLKWLKAPEAEKAFQEAFTAGIQKYRQNRARNAAAQAVASVLVHVANNDTSNIDRAMILEQIFADRIELETLSSVLSRHIFAVEGLVISKDIVSKELYWLINTYLRPAFRSQHYFANVVGFAEVIGLLQDIRENLVSTIDLDELQKGYYKKTANKYELITMQGISPKVQNRTIGIRMHDVFIALEARHIDDDNLIKRLNINLSYVPKLLEQQAVEEKFQGWKTKITTLSDVDTVLQLNSAIENAEAGFKTWATLETLFPEDFSETSVLKSSPRRIKSLLNTLHYLRRSKQLESLIKSPHLVVQGHPGSGKSTIVKYICWAISSHNSELVGAEVLNYIPIPIRAIEFGESLQKGQVDSLDEFIVEQSGRFAPLFRFALSAGKAFIFIDGLDEVGLATLRSRVKERVDDFVSDPAFSDNRILITTRIVGYQPDGIIAKFPHFELKELNDEQISKFVQNWYQAIHEEMPASVNVEAEQKQLLDAVLKNPSIHKMAQNPLLLTIIALIKWQGRTLPEQRVLLYDAAAQTLIRSWPLAQRAVEFDELFIREWLAPVAEIIFNNPTSDLIDEYSLADELVASMMKLKSIPKSDAKSETRKLLDSISFHSGILLPRGTDADGRNMYGFLHQTFAEYLTAYYFAGKWEDRELDIKKYAHDPYWREVLLLMAGHLGIQRRAKAGQLLRAILEMNSSEYEPIIHRDLILAGRILGDAVPAPAEVVEQILLALVELWHTTKYTPLKEEIEEVFGLLKSTEYSPVLGRIVKSHQVDDKEILKLCELIGSDFFRDDLVILLNSNDPKTKLSAAGFLAANGDPRGIESLLRILEEADISIALMLFSEFSKLKNDKGIIATFERIVHLSNPSHLSSLISINLYSPTAERNAFEMLEHSRSSLSQPAKWMLAILLSDGPNSEEYLLDCLNSEDDSLRLEAGKRLAAKQVSLGAETLIRLTESTDKTIREGAIYALANLKREEAIPFLKSIVDNETGTHQFKAAQSLFKKFDDGYGKQVLLGALLSDDQGLEEHAEILIRLIANDAINQDYIEGLLNNPNRSLQIKLASKLVANGHLEGREHLRKTLLVSDPEIRLQAAEELLNLNVINEEDKRIASETIEALLDCDRLDISFLAALRFLAIDNEKGIGRLEDLTKCGDVDIRYKSAAVFYAFRDEKYFNLMHKNLSRMLSDFETIPPRAEYRESLQSVADIAFHFIHQQILPTGELTSKDLWA